MEQAHPEIPKRDFIDVHELAQRTGFATKTLLNQRSTGRGAFAPILVRLGGKVGCWRADYEQLIADQRRLKVAA